jgi:hypothetical protein
LNPIDLNKKRFQNVAVMPQRPPAALLILLAVASFALHFIFRETGVALLVEGVIENAAHALGIERAKLMAQIANLILPTAAVGLCLYASYRIGANEHKLGYAPHLEIPLYEAAKLTYGGVRKSKGVATGELLANKIDSLITHYCIALTMPRDDGKPLADLYGCRVPSERKELITVSKDKVFVVRGDKVILKDHEGYGEYHHLLVRKSQVKKAIKTIASWEYNPANMN